MALKTIFLSYSRKDKRWLAQLKNCLQPLLHGREIELWDDTLIEPGKDWDAEIQAAINYSCAAVLLVSPEYLASPYVKKHELPVFLAQAEERGKLVLWVPIRKSSYRSKWIATYQSVHPPTEPLDQLKRSARNTALARICEEIVAQVDKHPPLPFQRWLGDSGTKLTPVRLFPRLPPALFQEQDLQILAEEMETDGDRQREGDAEREENKGVPAGYTFLGGFIHNDITLPKFGGVEREDLLSFFGDYAPAFDLNGVYGSGPKVQSYLYRAIGRYPQSRFLMVLGDTVGGSESDPNARQIPRAKPDGQGDALIADVRNDDNIIASQLHSMMLRFHNRMTDVLPDASLAEVQQAVRFHYQWMVIHDFLETLIGPAMLQDILPHLAKGTTPRQDPPRFRFYKPAMRGRIPLEFSVAVFRFGHSMLRRRYRLNGATPPRSSFTGDFTDSLIGNREWPRGWAIDWDLFFEMPSASCGANRVQYSSKIDTSTLNPFAELLPPGVAAKTASMAFRHLQRGLRIGLPSGQSISTFMEIPPIPDERLAVGLRNKQLIALSLRFRNNAPLWYYVLAEAQQQFVNDDTPIGLGPVAGRIVGEVLIGLMLANPRSFLRADPTFQPYEKLRSAKGEFRMADLLRQAMLA
jgi:hypothetical protein